MRWYVLAPGPSASKQIADRLPDDRTGVVTCAYILKPGAAFLASNDLRWWRKYPEAKQFAGAKYSANRISGVEQIKRNSLLNSASNSGVLALECAKLLGATCIVLLGFDAHGSHFFGKYKNGLPNTTDQRRRVHQHQFAWWKKSNEQIHVVNATPGSALKCFARGCLDEELAADGFAHADHPVLQTADDAGDSDRGMATLPEAGA